MSNHRLAIPLTRLCAKPHVAVFITNYFSPRLYPSPDGQQPGMVAPRIHGRGILFNAIAFHLTPHHHERMTAAPAGHQVFEVLMPQAWRRYYLSEGQALELAKSLEEMFWNEAEKFVSKTLNENHIFKEQAIRMFYSRYGITEDVYPVENFRRQLLRYRIGGAQPPMPDTYHYSYKLSDKEVMQLYRLRAQGLSLRRLGQAYNLSHMQAKRLSEKILSELSQNVTKTLQY